MTGTAMTEAPEFFDIYKMNVVAIPTNVAVCRADEDDEFYKSMAEKFEAITQEIKAKQKIGQPVLVGTISIEKSEMLSEFLEKGGIQHSVLNARFHEQEAHIVAQAGRMGMVTVSTNMEFPFGDLHRPDVRPARRRKCRNRQAGRANAAGRRIGG